MPLQEYHTTLYTNLSCDFCRARAKHLLPACTAVPGYIIATKALGSTGPSATGVHVDKLLLYFITHFWSRLHWVLFLQMQQTKHTKQTQY